MSHNVFIELRTATSALRNLSRGDTVLYNRREARVEGTSLGMQFWRGCGHYNRKLVLFVRISGEPYPIPHYMLKKVVTHS